MDIAFPGVINSHVWDRAFHKLVLISSAVFGGVFLHHSVFATTFRYNSSICF